MRDMRDPQSLGELFLALRGNGVPIEIAAQAPAKQTNQNPSCVEKYGRPDEVKEHWEEIRIR